MYFVFFVNVSIQHSLKQVQMEETVHLGKTSRLLVMLSCIKLEHDYLSVVSTYSGFQKSVKKGPAVY